MEKEKTRENTGSEAEQSQETIDLLSGMLDAATHCADKAPVASGKDSHTGTDKTEKAAAGKAGQK